MSARAKPQEASGKRSIAKTAKVVVVVYGTEAENAQRDFPGDVLLQGLAAIRL